MPARQHRTDLHRLFLTTRRGNTLIVSPKGDPAGFANLNFHVELSALMGLIDQPHLENLLVDFSSSNYFGAKMLGAMTELAKKIQAQGGRFAVCELSSDMRELLKLFNVNGKWEQYDTEAEGLRALVKETPWEQCREHWKALAVLACCLAGYLAALLPWDQYHARRVNQHDYETVRAIWSSMQDLKARNAPPGEWWLLQNRARRELNPLVPELERRGGVRGTQARVAQQLLFASRDHILKRLLVQKDRLDLAIPTGPDSERSWALAQVHIEKARYLMEGLDPGLVEYPTYYGEPFTVPEESESTPGEEAPTPPAVAEAPHRYVPAPEESLP